jgi:hypothetical protein
MATIVPVPSNYVYSFAINPDGSLRPGGDINSTAAPSLFIVNMGGDGALPASAVLQMIYTACAFPWTPSGQFGRCLIDWQKLRNAFNSGTVLAASPF